MEVSIVIPTYRDWNRLAKCLNTLTLQSFPKGEIEIIIANNDVQDLPPGDFELPTNAKLINVAQPGSYAARNAAIEIARGRIIGFTDSDCIPDQNWVRNAVEYLQTHPEISRIGGSVKIFYREDKPNEVELYDNFFAFNQRGYVQNNGTAVTANMFTYASTFKAVGLFNSKLMSGGDFQWGTIANKNGFKIAYVEDVMVKHPARNNLTELLKKEKRVGDGQANFLHRQSKFATIFSFTKAFVPKLWEIKMVFNNGKGIPPGSLLKVLILRQYLVINRAYAKLQAQISMIDKTKLN
ncbi:glycosyltransferase [Dyadobacter aurulentus]|uniref:glycosyltransferase n=1 Tax=Dyadobacter sp. UC 10 TaxID=2605428 RepID=UPI0011F240BF|nr:glycosyltransferase family 2 protein [Dyadobacter sp. UC 10]KAA0988871.1 glycosyltransferase family 2 protein [Dyadobacter sp. UC 10]